jgi:hypothetical protein
LIFAASALFRILLLLIEPVPIPLFHDEFSFLLGADTFFHLRLTNPTPAVPTAFETIHVNLWPTYQSMYIPGTALLLTLGKVLGCPWIAVLLATAIFCAMLYWMVSAWLPRPYALVSSFIAIGTAGNMNWWFDNYFVVALPALGTTLVLGSLPRILTRRTWQSSLPLGMGLLILMFTRPYEGLCVALPCLLVLLWQLRTAHSIELLSLATAPLILLGAGLVWLMYYNWRGTGHPLLFAYVLNFRTYHITGPFLFSAKHQIPSYRLDTLRRFYIFAEVRQFDFMRAHPWEFLARKIWIYYYTYLFGFGMLSILGLIYLSSRWRERLLLAPLVGFSGFALNVVLMGWSPFPQYAAPASALMILLVTFGLAALRQWDWRGISGVKVSRGLVLSELMLGFSLFGLRIADSRDYQEPQYVTKDRIRIEKAVLSHPGKQLCLVRYTPGHEAWQEWVFNGADPETERLIWARSLDPETDRKVIAAYPGREVWLVQPDFANDLLRPYPMSSTSLAAGAPIASARGEEPRPGLGERDVFSEFRLPPLEDTAEDPLWTSVRSTQVLTRTQTFHLDGRSQLRPGLLARAPTMMQRQPQKPRFQAIQRSSVAASPRSSMLY